MAVRYRIVVAEDEADLRSAVAEALGTNPAYECLQASDGEAALARVREGGVNLIVSDLNMPRMGGEELLAAVRAINPDIPVLIMTGYATIESAVELLHRGAYDYIAKPFKLEELHGRVGRALERLTLLDEIRSLRTFVEEHAGMARIIGAAPAMLKVLRQLPSVSRAEAAVILYGESGTGKEVVARAIHTMSQRAGRPFVTVNCGALPETLLENELFGHVKGAFTDARDNHAGLIQSADGGTLFLDEIGEMSAPLQVKLLRFLQEKEYRPLGSTRTQHANVRIVAATNRDLRRAIAEGSFREDLFYRLNIIPLTLPPLRDRKEDIPLLVSHFLKRATKDLASPVEALSPLAIQKLMGYDWPGNVRELENKIMQIVALATTNVVLPEDIDLPETHAVARADGRLKSYREAKREMVATFEVGYVTRLLAMTDGNISEAARLARKHRRAFWEIMKKHGIRGRMSPAASRPEARPDPIAVAS